MDLIWFESAVIAPDMKEHVLIALFDGSIEDRLQERRLVTMLICKAETARELWRGIEAALRERQ